MTSSMTWKCVAWSILVFCLPAGVKQRNWWVDGLRLNQHTAEWKPFRLYSDDIERALTILASTDESKVAYLRTRGNPIIFVPRVEGTLGDTTPEGVIEISDHFRGKPPEIAVVLSHEIFHAERHDPYARPARYSMVRRIFWRGEEDQAHTDSLWTAIRLWWRGNHTVWNALGFEWLFEFLLYPFLGVWLAVDLVLQVWLILSMLVGLTKERAAYRPLSHDQGA